MPPSTTVMPVISVETDGTTDASGVGRPDVGRAIARAAGRVALTAAA